MFLLALPISGVIAGPMSGFFLDGMNGVWGLRGWQWLFILEGAPSVVLGVIAYYYLDDRPQDASWLSDEEKHGLEHELNAEQLKANKGASSFSRIFRNPQIYGLSAVYFCFYTILNAMTIWPPSILKFLGVQSATEIGLRTSALSGAAVVGMILIGWNSDRCNERRWHLIACCLLAGAAFMALPLGAGNPDLTTLLLAVASIGIYSYFGLFWTIPRTKLDKEAAAAGIAVITTSGAVGSIISPVFVGWMREFTGSFYGALGVLGAAFCLSTIVLYFCSSITRKTGQLNAPAAASEAGIAGQLPS
jgi:sugar phosphate permease